MKSKSSLRTLSKQIFQKYEIISKKHALPNDITKSGDVLTLLIDYNIPYISLFKILNIFTNNSKFSFYNLTRRPLEFVTLPEQVIDYEKAMFIINKDKLPIKEEDKYISWIYDFILFRNNTIYIKYSYLRYKFKEYHNENMDNVLGLNKKQLQQHQNVMKYKTVDDVLYCTLYKINEIENDITTYVRKLNKVISKPINIIDIKNGISKYEKEKEITFLKLQRSAIRHSIQNNVHLICGYPGTGKTTIIECICRFYEDQLICLTAPTGMAVNNLLTKTKITNSITGTLHKLIYGKFNELDTTPGVVIIDEFSMVDNCLFRNILKYCCDFGCKLIILADHHQLPPIGGGYPLLSLIRSKSISNTFLTEIKRQNNGKLKDAILNISADILISKKDIDKDTFHFYNYSEENVRKLIDKFHLHPDNCQFISPQHKHDLGTINMNNFLQSIFSTKNRIIKVTQKYKNNFTIYENDMVVRTVNNYTSNELYANGDIGIVKINPQNDNMVSIYYKDSDIIQENISNEDLYDEFQLSYCLTVHKVQGSQYDNIVIFLSNDHRFSWENSEAKKLLYTAISRGKNRCFILGDPDLLYSAQCCIPKKYISDVLEDF